MLGNFASYLNGQVQVSVSSQFFFSCLALYMGAFYVVLGGWELHYILTVLQLILLLHIVMGPAFEMRFLLASGEAFVCSGLGFISAFAIPDHICHGVPVARALMLGLLTPSAAAGRHSTAQPSWSWTRKFSEEAETQLGFVYCYAGFGKRHWNFSEDNQNVETNTHSVWFTSCYYWQGTPSQSLKWRVTWSFLAHDQQHYDSQPLHLKACMKEIQIWAEQNSQKLTPKTPPSTVRIWCGFYPGQVPVAVTLVWAGVFVAH